MKISDCPRYQTCSAPICPLDIDWQKRVNCNEDPICFYLSQSVKHDARSDFERAGLGNLFEAIQSQRDLISAHFKRLKRKLDQAKLSPSRLTRRFINHDQKNQET